MFKFFENKMNKTKGAVSASARACSCTENKALILNLDTVMAVSLFVALISIVIGLIIIIPEKFNKRSKTVLVQ